MSSDWKWPGSRWWRVDLHTHSPASHDFGTQADRETPDWAGWVQAVQNADLDAVALTDHNTATGVDPIKAAADALEPGPTVFPGVEVTASCGTHILVILDPASTREHVADLLSQAGISPDQRGSKDARSTRSVEQILGLAAQCPLVFLAAHGNGPAGLLEHDGQQRIQELKHRNLAGVEIDPDRSVDETWIDGSRAEIGRRLPQVWCSDAHQLADLGRRFTWIKMTRPDLEGLRLALLDGDGSSLRPAHKGAPDDPNRHASFVIEQITVHAAKYMGRPQSSEFRLNPWLNAIIGGRGTGKSTLLDFCRRMLRRDAELDGTSLREIYDRRLSTYASRQDEGLLTETTRLEIVYRKDTDRFLISWDQGGRAPAIQRFDGQDWQPESGEVRERFPVRIYSQKQLFELAQDPNALLRVIDDATTVRGSEWQRRIDETGDRYLSLRAAERSSRTKAGDLASRRASLTDVRRKLDVLQQGGGAEALAAYRKTNQQNDTWHSILDDASARVDAVARASEDLAVADLDLPDAAAGDPAREALLRLHRRLQEAVAHLQGALSPEIDRACQSLAELRSDTDVDARAWKAAVAAIQAEYEKAAAQLAESGISSPDEYRTLLTQATTLEREIQTLEKEAERADDLAREAATVLSELRQHMDAWSKSRADFANQASGERLRVKVRSRFSLDRQDIVTALRERLGIDRFDHDYEDLAARIAPDDDAWSWERFDTVIHELREVAAGRGQGQAFRDQRFRTAVRRLAPERLDRLALFAPGDSVDVGFRDAPNGGWSPLSHGSPGQQTAALLAFVLGYGDEPILLDQPEDDLDNTLIYRVLVQRLRETKATRQVIVVTHNPNIVVHGDAELILSLDSRGGQTQIACQGGLQEQAVRDEICRVMEGGKKAFEDRYRRMMPAVGTTT